MRVAVCIPWRTAEPARVNALEFVWNNQWSWLPWPLYLGDSGDAHFNRGASRNAAARTAGDWDVAIFADADCLVDHDLLREAVQIAYLEDVVVFPHNKYHALDQRGRATHMAGASSGAGTFAISREAWHYVQGFDERLAGWGYEDAAFYLATSGILGQPYRLHGVIRELWHPKTERQRPRESQRLLDRYKRAKGDREHLLAIVNENPLE